MKEMKTTQEPELIQLGDLTLIGELAMELLFMIPKSELNKENPLGIQYDLNLRKFDIGNFAVFGKFIPYAFVKSNKELDALSTDLINRHFKDEMILESLFSITEKIDKIKKEEKAVKVVQKAIEDGILSEDIFEKGRTGVYADTAENKRLKRVGQKYGSNKTKEETLSSNKKTEDKETSGKDISMEEHAKNSSGTALETASKEAKDPEIRMVAKKELQRREKEENVEDSEKKGEGKKEEENPPR